MNQCRSISTPLNPGFQIRCDSDNCAEVDTTDYQSLIGSIMYLAISTRPDIMHSISKLAQRNSNPHVEHDCGAKHILRYLSRTIDLKLHYRKTGQRLHAFVDADWANDSLDRKSYSGYCFYLGGSPFSWESKKQGIVALSSTEAEYIALSTASREAIYLRRLLEEIAFHPNAEPIEINGDNLSA